MQEHPPEDLNTSEANAQYAGSVGPTAGEPPSDPDAQPEVTTAAEYIRTTPYPYEPARNDPRAAPERPPSDYTPNLAATAAADQQMHTQAYAQQHPREHGPEATAWVRLTALIGRPLLDLENGRLLGQLDDLVLTRDHRFVAAFALHDATAAPRPVYPARGATIGHDAIVLPAASLQDVSPESFQGMPLARRLLRMPLVTAGGKNVGKVSDVRFDPQTFTVFLQVEDEGNLLQRLLRQFAIIPAPAIQIYGQDVLIVSDAMARQYLGGKE